MANDAYEVKRGIIGKPKVAYQCAKCHNDLESDLTDAGKKDTCPLCKAAFIVPGQRELKEMQNAAKQKEEERRVAEAHRIRQREEKLRLEEDARTRREEERKKREDEAGAREAEEAAQRRKDREKGCLPPFAEEAAQRRKEASRNLVNCPDCGRPVSRLAPTCPGCGRPSAGQIQGFGARLCPHCGAQAVGKVRGLHGIGESLAAVVLFLIGIIPGIIYCIYIQSVPFCSGCRRRV